MRYGFDPRSRTGSDDLGLGADRSDRGFDPRSRTGSDAIFRPVITILSGFDPRSRTGSDAARRRGRRAVRPVSIRAPARGATSRIRAITSTSARFDPRSRTGSDKGLYSGLSGGVSFRSALPHGERPSSNKDIQYALTFRSALPHGERPAPMTIRLPDRRVSIRAPARGATTSAAHRSPWRSSFDPRSRTGSDKIAPSPPGAWPWFRSALPHGERR